MKTFKFDEENFNKSLFIQEMKKIKLNSLISNINDILTFQNWYDKSLSFGTNYFEKYDELEYKNIQDYESKITFDVIVDYFFEIFDWFLDDENYENLVSKLLNVILGYDKYNEVESFKQYKLNIQNKIVETVKETVEPNVIVDKPVLTNLNLKQRKKPKLNFDIESKLNNLKKEFSNMDINDVNFMSKINEITKTYEEYKKSKQVNVICYDDSNIKSIFTLINKTDKKIIYNKLLKLIAITAVQKIKFPTVKINFDLTQVSHKNCSKCKISKDITNYTQSRDCTDGYFNTCINCLKS